MTWLGIALVLTLLGGLIGGLHVVKQHMGLQPETTRKLLHMIMGVATLSFPWLFDTAWPVVVLATVATAAMAALRWVPALRDTIGTVVNAVNRESLGEIYYPISVGLLFVLSNGDPILYCVPILMLGIGDAVAALIGLRYGLLKYTTAEGTKSAEGSLAFFTIAFFSTHIPVLLFTETGRLESLLIASIVGFLAMLLEAVAWKGLDNLFIPLGGFVFLDTVLTMDAYFLAARLVVIIGLVLFVVVYQDRTTLNDSALLGAALLGFLSWAVGGWQWIPAPLILFLSYTLLWPMTEESARRGHKIHQVLSVMTVGFIWLFVSVTANLPVLLYPYTLSYAAYLAIIGVTQLKYVDPHLSLGRLLANSVLKSWALVFVPYVLIEGLTMPAMICAAVAPLPIALAAAAVHKRYPHARDLVLDRDRWLWQGGLVGLVSMLALIPLMLLADG